MCHGDRTDHDEGVPSGIGQQTSWPGHRRKEPSMNASNGDLRTTVGSAVSRRVALRGLGGVGLGAALALGSTGRVAANHGHQIVTAPSAPISGDDPAAVVEAYLAAVN